MSQAFNFAEEGSTLVVSANYHLFFSSHLFTSWFTSLSRIAWAAKTVHPSSVHCNWRTWGRSWGSLSLPSSVQVQCLSPWIYPCLPAAKLHHLSVGVSPTGYRGEQHSEYICWQRLRRPEHGVSPDTAHAGWVSQTDILLPQGQSFGLFPALQDLLALVMASQWAIDATGL